MGGVSTETCWAIKKHWNNKFYYTVVSCWFFLRDLYYDARIHEHQVYFFRLVRVCRFYCLLFVVNWLVASLCSYSYSYSYSYPWLFLILVKINYRELYSINLNVTMWCIRWRFIKELLTHIFFECIHAYMNTYSKKQSFLRS
jgi:hypothetical protein